jgi:hypothetical protein
MKWYEAVRIAEEVQTLRERATLLHYSTLPVLFNIVMFSFELVSI